MDLSREDAAKNIKDYNDPRKIAKQNLEVHDNEESDENPFNTYYADECGEISESAMPGVLRLRAAKMSYIVDNADSTDDEESYTFYKPHLKKSAQLPIKSFIEQNAIEQNNSTSKSIAVSPAKTKASFNDLLDDDITDLYLHRMVATEEPGTANNYMKAFELYLDESDAHELNEKDSRGRTALHLAVQYSNVEAIAALLMCGADVNVADRFDKSPFTYCLDSYDMPNYKCNQMFYTFLGHVHKLVVIGLRVSLENRRCYARARSRHVFNDKQLQLSYAIELDKMQDVRLSYCTSLHDVLYQGADEIATSMLKRHTLEEVLTASDFYEEFPKLCCLLKLQYRRGLTRCKLMQPVKSALDLIARQGLPDPCSERIIRHLDDDEDLMSLMEIGVAVRDSSDS